VPVSVGGVAHFRGPRSSGIASGSGTSTDKPEYRCGNFRCVDPGYQDWGIQFDLFIQVPHFDKAGIVFMAIQTWGLKKHCRKTNGKNYMASI
jgi:hypothetical protein